MATIQVLETLELRKTLARQILIDTPWRQQALADIAETVGRATLPANQMLALAKVEQLRQQLDAPVLG